MQRNFMKILTEVFVAFLDFLGRLRNPILLSVFFWFVLNVGDNSVSALKQTRYIILFVVAIFTIHLVWYALKKIKKNLSMHATEKKQVFRIKLWLTLFLFTFICFISLFSSDSIFIAAILPMAIIFIPIKRKTDFTFITYEAVSISLFAVLLIYGVSEGNQLNFLSFLIYRILIKAAWSANIAKQQSKEMA